MALEQIKIKRRKTDDDAEMDITPMIDITFLLLIFFLVASKMDTPGSVELPVAKNGDSVTLDNSVILTVDVAADGKALVYKGQNKDSSNLIGGDEETQADAIAAYVDEVALGEAKETVIIMAAKGVKHGVISDVAKAVAKSDSEASLHVAVLDEG